MKQTILFIFLFCSIAVWGQDKNYSINGPIQFYDMNGNPNGYTKYNDTRRYWEYYDAQDRLRKTKAYVSDFRAEYYDSTGKIIGTEVYNEEENRVNCFDPYGRKDGYQKFDNATSSWEIFNSGNRKTATCKWNADKKLWEYKYAK